MFKWTAKNVSSLRTIAQSLKLSSSLKKTCCEPCLNHIFSDTARCKNRWFECCSFTPFGFLKRHPSNFYSQGMNDILAPIFAVFLAEKFSLTYIELENSLREVESLFIESTLMEVSLLGRSRRLLLLFAFAFPNERELLKRFRWSHQLAEEIPKPDRKKR